jgi:hypothetical protein
MSSQFLKQPLARTTLVEGSIEGAPYPQSTVEHESDKVASAPASVELPKAAKASMTAA